jgi:hypothetical protein
MSARLPGTASILLASLLALAAAGCSRKAAPATSATPFPALTPVATATAGAAAASTTPATAATATPTEPAGPNQGATIQVGGVSVVVDRFRAQVSDPDGVNIRSSPQVTADNRTGSLPQGAIVEVEGRVLQGQEAEPGQGTLWYYVGTAGNTPQFIYGAPGTITPLTGSATPGPVASATPAAGAAPATPAAPAAPAATPTATPS